MIMNTKNKTKRQPVCGDIDFVFGVAVDFSIEYCAI